MKKGLATVSIILIIFLMIMGGIFIIMNQNTVEATNGGIEKKKVKWNDIEIEKINFDTLIEAISTEEPENEGATEEELKNEKVTTVSNQAPYYIVVNYNANVVTIYKKDEKGEYTIPVKAMVCSTGVATPKSGIYKLTNARYKWRALFGGVYGQYAVKIVGNILFHSVPYLSTDNSTLEYWEYDKLGTSASAGCIRLTVTDALWIYNNCGSGTQVEFSSNAPIPLGKPSAKKISAYQDLRGFDPTDPATNNPWKQVNTSNNDKIEDNPLDKNNNINDTIGGEEKNPVIEEEGKEDPSNPDNADSDKDNNSENKEEDNKAEDDKENNENDKDDKDEGEKGDDNTSAGGKKEEQNTNVVKNEGANN